MTVGKYLLWELNFINLPFIFSNENGSDSQLWKTQQQQQQQYFLSLDWIFNFLILNIN